MEKSQGRVRNYVVFQKYSFCSMLAKTLCKMQIPYVQVDNEFHFDDKILRFYSVDESLELTGQVKFVCYGDNKIISLDPQSLLFTRNKNDLDQVFISPDEIVTIVDDYKDEEEVNKDICYTKQKRKQDNNMVNQKLRQNADMSKRFINRKRNDL